MATFEFIPAWSRPRSSRRTSRHAIDLPLVVNADNGYGNEDNVVRTVHELEHAGAAAMILEDQVLPKRCGHAAGKAIIPLDQYMRKLECALEARRTPMCIVARTDATSIDEGILRAKRLPRCGGGRRRCHRPRLRRSAQAGGGRSPGHKVINLIHGGKTQLLPSKQLHDLGFKIVLYSTPALYVAANAMLKAMTLLRETNELYVDLGRQHHVPRVPVVRRGALFPPARSERLSAAPPTAGSGAHLIDTRVIHEVGRARTG